MFTFLETVLGQVVAQFPGSYVHIGGDEVPKARWEDCERCRAAMAQVGARALPAAVCCCCTRDRGGAACPAAITPARRRQQRTAANMGGAATPAARPCRLDACCCRCCCRACCCCCCRACCCHVHAPAASSSPQEGLANEGELQSWFVRRISNFLAARGRRIIGGSAVCVVGGWACGLPCEQQDSLSACLPTFLPAHLSAYLCPCQAGMKSWRAACQRGPRS